MCLFPGNKHLASSLFELATPTDPSPPVVPNVEIKQPEAEQTVEEITKPANPPPMRRRGGLRRLMTRGRSRRIGLVESNLEVLGMEMTELLQLLTEQDSRRLRLPHAQAELRELQAVAAELQRRDRLQRRQQRTETRPRANNDASIVSLLALF